jgi:hypothetical protein
MDFRDGQRQVGTLGIGFTANGHNQVNGFGEFQVKGLRVMVGDVNALFCHDGNRQWVDSLFRVRASAEGFYAHRPRETFRHLAASGIARANEQNSLRHISSPRSVCLR